MTAGTICPSCAERMAAAGNARAERTASIADGRLQEGKGSGSKTAADEAARRITLQARGFAGEGGRRATDAIS